MRKKMEKIKMDFKRFGIWIVSFLMKQIEEIKKLLNDKLIPILCLGNIFVWSVIGQQSYGKVEDMPTFIITLIAFLAAACAIWQQHIALKHQKEASQQQEKDNKKLLKHQKEAGIKQEIIGAWQVLANKAAGNSGKIEAIEFLAKQGKSLQGIDMSKDTHGGQVYLNGLDVSEKEPSKRVNLISAKFQGAGLYEARFDGADLREAHFDGARLWDANFEGVNLTRAHFEGVVDLQDAIFKDSYVWLNDKKYLPSTLESDRFKFDFILNYGGTKKSAPELDKKGKPTGNIKYFIQLVQKNPK